MRLALSFGLVLALAGYLWTQWRALDRRNEPDTEAHLAHFAEVRGLPEPDWADPTPLEARRLRSVPMQPSLTLVPPPADDSWLEDLITSRPSPFAVPQQRKAGEQS